VHTSRGVCDEQRHRGKLWCRKLRRGVFVSSLEIVVRRKDDRILVVVKMSGWS